MPIPATSHVAARWLRGGCVVCGDVAAGLCPRCLSSTSPPPATPTLAGTVWSLFAYEGHGAQIVQALKFRDGRRAIGPLSALLADLVLSRLDHDLVDEPVVTWVPTTAVRRRRRGFDQAELLGRGLARRLDVAAVGLLRRPPAPPQTGRTRAERTTVAFAATRRRDAPILVVDDVCTTGATLRGARRALTDRGMDVVGKVVVAQTPSAASGSWW